MSWDVFQTWRRESGEIADATAYGTTLLMERAPAGSDVLEFMSVNAPPVLSTYAQSSQDSALGYLTSAQRSAGLSPVLYEPATAMVTATMVEPIVKWALTDVEMPWTMEDVLPKVAQGSMRLVSNAGRETVENGVGEIAGVAGRRVPRADACAWCRFMSTVTHWNGEWPDSAYHGHCRCEPILLPDGQTGEVPEELESLWDEYADQYYDAASWARVEHRRIDDELWERTKGPGRSYSARRRMRGSLRRKELPTLQQLTLTRMRAKYGAR